MVDYCNRRDIENIFGIGNVIKWTDLDNDTAEIVAELTTRTDADTGIATMASGHGVTTNDTVDIFWKAGRIHAMTVTASDATTIGIDGGSGDDLPIATTTIGVRLSDKITSRISEAITEAMDDIDEKMLGGPYTVPIAKADTSIPTGITNTAAKLAGVWLYENRGVQDYDAEKRTAKHRLSYHKDEAYRKLSEYRAQTRRLDAVIAGISIPYAHDHYTQIADDSNLTSKVRQGKT